MKCNNIWRAAGWKPNNSEIHTGGNNAACLKRSVMGHLESWSSIGGAFSDASPAYGLQMVELVNRRGLSREPSQARFGEITEKILEPLVAHRIEATAICICFLGISLCNSESRKNLLPSIIISFNGHEMEKNLFVLCFQSKLSKCIVIIFISVRQFLLNSKSFFFPGDIVRSIYCK